MSMAKKRRSYPKSPNLRIDFKPNTTIYEKIVINGNTKSIIKLDVKPQKHSEPTIENILRINER